MNNLLEDILPFLCFVLHFPVAEIITLKGTLFWNCEYLTWHYNQQAVAQKEAHFVFFSNFT